MAICRYCLDNWAARSEQQLADRYRNIAGHASTEFARCPRCGGTEWATTDAMIDPRPQRGWLRRFLKMWKGGA